ncbi:MAG: hypothetical protein ACNA8W_14515, partial [Bradymonadaceae bacterium]
ALTEFLFPTRDTDEEVDGPRYRLSGPREIRALLSRLLRRFAQNRPVIVCLDDAQWNKESLRFADYVLSEGEGLPVLFLMTLRSDVLAADEALSSEVERLLSRENASSIDITPLGKEELSNLIDRILPLSPKLKETLLERTEGNPLFAIHIIKDWVARGLFTPEPAGFSLVERDGEPPLPDSIHELWLSRLDRLVRYATDEKSPAVWTGIELASILGRDVTDREWHAICVHTGVGRPERLRAELIEGGLAEVAPDGWAFTHGLLVDSIQRRTMESAAWLERNGEAAHLLESLYPDSPFQTAARRTRLWVAAGRLDRAIEATQDHITGLGKRGDWLSQLEATCLQEDLMDENNVAPNAFLRRKNTLYEWTCRLLLGTYTGDFIPPLEQLCEDARLAGDAVNLSGALEIIASIYQIRHQRSEALRYAQEALLVARESGQEIPKMLALHRLGWIHYFSGNLDAVREAVDEGQELARRSKNKRMELMFVYCHVAAMDSRQQKQKGLDLLQQALDEGHLHGFVEVERKCFNLMGDILRFSGDADGARRHLLENRRLCEAMNYPEGLALNAWNLGQVELLARDFDQANEHFCFARQRYEEMGLERTNDRNVAMITLAAGRNDWDTVVTYMAPYREGWPPQAKLEKDHPWLIELAGNYAAEGGASVLAIELWKLSRSLWETLSDQEGSERVSKWLSEYSGGELSS